MFYKNITSSREFLRCTAFALALGTIPGCHKEVAEHLKQMHLEEMFQQSFPKKIILKSAEWSAKIWVPALLFLPFSLTYLAIDYLILRLEYFFSAKEKCKNFFPSACYF